MIDRKSLPDASEKYILQKFVPDDPDVDDPEKKQIPKNRLIIELLAFS
jgi:hypothetical protein